MTTTDWNPVLRGEFAKPYWSPLQEFVQAERRRSAVYPPEDRVFAALHLTRYADTKVLILGQDPYHGPGQAHGLCFSVPAGVDQPPSLVNIFKELHDDLGIERPGHGNLEHWARQGVLMLNAVLTVRAHAAGSHAGKGWETFTDEVIAAVNAKPERVVFILWGAYARKKKPLIDTSRHVIIESAHPSPLSAHNGFFGSRPFSKANAALEAAGREPIDWRIRDRIAGVTTRHRRTLVNGVELDLLEAGPEAGPPVILSHGFPEAAHSWRHTLPALSAAGYHAIAPDQRGYGRSSRPSSVDAYGIRELTGDLLGLLDDTGHEQAVFVGHDWGALIVWEMARLHPERVRAVVGVSVPYIAWPAPPTQLMRMMFGDRFFYILYFQAVGPAEAELQADVRHTMGKVLWSASGPGFGPRIGQPVDVPPMEGTGFLTMMGDPPALPYEGPEGPWLTAEDLDTYTDLFTASGFFGPVSYYRNLDANYEIVKDLGADRLTMPSAFIGGALDPVLVMDPTGIERMNVLPDFRGSTMIDGVGHWTQQEAPDAFNRALLGFLASL